MTTRPYPRRENVESVCPIMGNRSTLLLCLWKQTSKQAILGLKTCMQLGLIKRVHVINKEVRTKEKRKDATTTGAMHSDWVKEYKEVFRGIGRLPG